MLTDRSVPYLSSQTEADSHSKTVDAASVLLEMNGEKNLGPEQIATLQEGQQNHLTWTLGALID